MGDPRERAETLDANHLQMCQMSGYQDPNYRKVAGEIRACYRFVANGENINKHPVVKLGSMRDNNGAEKLSVSELGAE